MDSLNVTEAVQPETRAVARWLTSRPFTLGVSLYGGTVVARYPYNARKGKYWSFSQDYPPVWSLCFCHEHVLLSLIEGRVCVCVHVACVWFSIAVCPRTILGRALRNFMRTLVLESCFNSRWNVEQSNCGLFHRQSEVEGTIPVLWNIALQKCVCVCVWARTHLSMPVCL